MLVMDGGNVAFLGVGRNDQQRNAEPKTVVSSIFGGAGSYQPP